MQDEIANADAPPPEGSTATTTWCCEKPSRRQRGSFWTSMRSRLRKASMSALGKAFWDPCETKKCTMSEGALLKKVHLCDAHLPIIP